MIGRLRTIDGSEHPIGEPRQPIECFRCGICCQRYQPPLPPEEVEAIAAGLGMGAKDFLSRYGQLTYAGYLLRQSQGACVFLTWEDDAKATCRIHPFRPKACQNWTASLSRPECREGLSRRKAKGGIMLATQLYPSKQAFEKFCEDLHQDKS